MQVDRAVGRRRRLVQSHQHPAVWLAHRALEDLLAVLAQHLVAGHAKQLLRRPVHPGDAEFGIVQNQSVGKLVENRFENAGSLPAWGELRHLTWKLVPIIASRLREFAQPLSNSGGMPPPGSRRIQPKRSESRGLAGWRCNC